MFEVLNNANGIAIKYRQAYLKRIFISLLCIDLFFWSASILMLLLHFTLNISIFISAILAVAGAVFVLIFAVTYTDLKRFRLVANRDSLHFVCHKKDLIIPWSEIKSCGIITRAGSADLSSFFLEASSDYYTDSKNTFFFSYNASPNLKKLVYHIRTTTLIDHGIVKDMCYVSEKRGGPIFRVLFDIVEEFNQNPNLKIEKTDRTNL